MDRPPIEIAKRLWKVSYYLTIPQQERPILNVKWFHSEEAAMAYREEAMRKTQAGVQVVAYKLDEVVA